MEKGYKMNNVHDESGDTNLEADLHDVLELSIDLLGGPCQPLAILSHLETGDGDTAAVGCLCGRVFL